MLHLVAGASSFPQNALRCHRQSTPLLLAFPTGKASLLRRFFLFPTKAMLLWEPCGRPHRVAPTDGVRMRPLSLILNIRYPFRNVTGFSTGRSRTPLLRRLRKISFLRPRQLEKGFSSWHIRAPDETSRFRGTR